MKIGDLSPKSRATLEKLAKAHGVKPVEILRHIVAISSRRKVSKHSSLLYSHNRRNTNDRAEVRRM